MCPGSRPTWTRSPISSGSKAASDRTPRRRSTACARPRREGRRSRPPALPAPPSPPPRLRTWVATPAGELSFQEWFVRRGHRDEVDGVRFEGAEEASAAPGVLAALTQADLIAIAPSNPFVSIGPILAVQEIREALERRRAPAVAVSPLIAGRAVRGPADRMLTRLAGGTGPAQVTDCYKGLIDALVVDEADADEDAGIPTIVTRTLMRDADARRRLAEAVLGAPV